MMIISLVNTSEDMITLQNNCVLSYTTKLKLEYNILYIYIFYFYFNSFTYQFPSTKNVLQQSNSNNMRLWKYHLLAASLFLRNLNTTDNC